MQIIPWLLLLFVIVLGTLGQLSLKYAVEMSSASKSVSQPVPSLLLSRYFWIWFISYVLVTVLWLFVLRTIPLSQAFPALGLTFALVPLASHHFLREQVVFGQWLGIVIIVVGTILVVQT